MNDADKRAYSDAFWKYADENICREKDFEAGWQAACEWRDSQVGEPFGWVNSQGQFMTHQEKLDAPIEFVEREVLELAVPCIEWMVVNQGIRGDVPEKFNKIKAALAAAKGVKNATD